MTQALPTVSTTASQKILLSKPYTTSRLLQKRLRQSFASAQNQAQPASYQGTKSALNEPAPTFSQSEGMSFLDIGQVTIHPP